MVIFILGPTASGKTKISVEIAKKINGEIIGADSVQIYKDLVIGAASPTVQEMEGVPHHLIGTHELNDQLSAGIYSNLALNAIREVKSRGKIPVIAGGTNFYVDALINGLSPVPDLNEEERKKYSDHLDLFTTEELFNMLLKADPHWAGQISSRNDRQRIKRGLEVAELTGTKLSDWNRLERTKKYDDDFLAVVIDMEREKLYEKINIRSQLIVNSGLIEEVERVNRSGYNSGNCKALNSIGYLEAEKYLKGEIPSRDELIETIALNTRHLAKRQLTWLRKRDYVIWKDVYSVVKSALDVLQNRCQYVSKN